MLNHLLRPRTALVAAAAFCFAAPTAAQAATTVNYDYSLAGNVQLTSRAKGNVPLSGSIGANLTLATGAFTADVKLNTVTANLKEYGFVPVKARVAFESVGQATGQLTDGALTTTTQQTIKLLSATVFGVNIVTDSKCRTINPSTITLTSSAFDPLAGGTLTGAFSIGKLTGCGPLTWDLSDAIVSKNNKVTVALTA